MAARGCFTQNPLHVSLFRNILQHYGLRSPVAPTVFDEIRPRPCAIAISIGTRRGLARRSLAASLSQPVLITLKQQVNSINLLLNKFEWRRYIIVVTVLIR